MKSKPAKKLDNIDTVVSVEFYAPIKIIAEMNWRGHWAVRKKRFDVQAMGIRASFGHLAVSVVRPWKQWRITFTRVGKRVLDDDNLAGGCKHVRDVVAGIIGVDDGSKQYQWCYDQTIGKEYGLWVRIERMKEPHPITVG